MRANWASAVLLIFVIGAQTSLARTNGAASMMTGTVYDESTKQPIEGAFVMAGYRVRIVGAGADTTWCVKTKGMYTGKDGRYAFPVEKDDGLSPFIAAAIMPGYYRGLSGLSRKREDGGRSYEGMDLGLIPQNPDAPRLLYGQGDDFCYKAATREDAEAGAEFLRIKRKELMRLGVSRERIDGVDRQIKALAELPVGGKGGDR